MDIKKTIARFLSKVDKVEISGCWLWNGKLSDNGRGVLKWDGKRGLAHRLSYILFKGPIETGLVVDHVCGNPLCVNPDHLRTCTPSQNSRNRLINRNSTSGLKGVSPTKTGKWTSAITVDGKLYRLGTYKTKIEAHEAYCKAAIELHGEFANYGYRSDFIEYYI